MMAVEPTVFVIGADPSVCRRLEHVLQSTRLHPEAFRTGEDFVKACNPQRTGCLVVDVGEGRPAGLGLQEKLRSLGYTIPVIFVSKDGDVPTAVRAIQAGAVDFLQTPLGDQDLLDAIGRAVERDRQSRCVQLELEQIQRRIALLTPRERQVLELVVTGLPNKQIAARLGTSEKTIKVHRARVFDKMQAESIVDLVLQANRMGLCKTKVQSGYDLSPIV